VDGKLPLRAVKQELQQIRVGQCVSDFAMLTSGVVQGSGIGIPIMFVLYIDQSAKILDQVRIRNKIFASDVKVYVRIASRNDTAKLQSALDILFHTGPKNGT